MAPVLGQLICSIKQTLTHCISYCKLPSLYGTIVATRKGTPVSFVCLDVRLSARAHGEGGCFLTPGSFATFALAMLGHCLAC